MKRIFSVLLATMIGGQMANAQCSSALNNFEIRLTPTGSNQLNISMRYHANGVSGSESILPTTQSQLDGLVFGITWPKSSKVQLTKCQSASAPFAVEFDQTATSVQNKTSQDNIKTLFHNNIETMPTAFGFEWKNDQWIDIANVTYSGTLAQGEYFSLLTCDYGAAHPNSYTGNSTTDPWFAMLSTTGDYLQYSPKMITELPSSVMNTISVYPVPTTGDLTVEVESASTTNAVVKVMDMTGRIVKTILFDIEKGRNKNTINIGELPQGDYMIQLTDGKAINFSKQITKI